jgi:hypothetical protein
MLNVVYPSTSTQESLMPSIDPFPASFQTLFTTTANQLAAETGVIQRQRKLSGGALIQTLVFGWLNQPEATVTQLTQVAALRGVVLTPQALDQRFTPELVTCLERFFAGAAAELCADPGADPVAIPLLQRFRGVWLLDSTTLSLPNACAPRWPGCGGRPGEGLSAVKIQARIDLLQGRFDVPELMPGRCQDRASAAQHAALPVGSLRLSDLGYFTLSVFRQLDADGSFFLTRVPVNVTLLSPTGDRIADVPRWLEAQVEAGGGVDQPMRLGVREQLPIRLLGLPVPEAVAAERRRRLRRTAKKQGQMVSKVALARAGWTVLATNVPADRLSLAEAGRLYRARWQIELLFKRWKQDGQLARWRSANPNRILVEVYAKLVGLLLQRRLLVAGVWAHPHKSLAKAGRAIRDHFRVIAAAFDHPPAVRRALAQLQRCLQAGTTTGSRKNRPSTAHDLLNSHRQELR